MLCSKPVKRGRVLDSRGMIKRVNHRFESLYGLDRKTILGKSIKMIMKRNTDSPGTAGQGPSSTGARHLSRRI